eukprot:1307902-Rhodomonas_salina.5
MSSRRAARAVIGKSLWCQTLCLHASCCCCQALWTHRPACEPYRQNQRTARGEGSIAGVIELAARIAVVKEIAVAWTGGGIASEGGVDTCSV